MAYIALYRKYRSQSFDEVVGQEHVTTVLRNALRLGRIAHAYLFCGPRGCGKTSTARLLARALNCLSADGPTPTPCGECAMCSRIRDGAAIDVIEMDAASETGIDDVREKIIENAKYSPAEARFKVYIIDEVHDLSQKAFDSLLKTIEEPPAHVVFVLATTEAHKVPITIRSRCQRMDFRRGIMSDLSANLRRVLEQEDIDFEPEAVSALASAAEGSFRDSLSLLEQVLAYTEGKLTAAAVHSAVGTVGPEMLDDVVRVLAADDAAEAFHKAGEIVEAGKDVKQVLAALQGHLRNLLVAAVASGPEALTEVPAERFGELKRQAGQFRTDQLLRMMDILAEAERDSRFTNLHRLLLERAMWRILPRHLDVGRVVVQAAAPEPAPRASEAPREFRHASSGAEQARAQFAPRQAAPAAPPAEAHAAAAPPPQAPAPRPKPVDPNSLDVDVIRRVWPRVRERVAERSPAMRAQFTADVQVLGLEGRTVVIGCPNEFVLGRVDRPAGRQFIENVLSEELGLKGLSVRCTLHRSEEERGAAAGAGTTSPLPLDAGADGSPAPVSFVQQVVDAFNGKLVDE